jgi:hypothetical protein
VIVKLGSKSPRQGITRAPRRGFWELWSVRFVSVVVLLATFLFVAVVGDPDTESWQGKTWELLHNIAATAVGHPLTAADNAFGPTHELYVFDDARGRARSNSIGVSIGV